VKDFVLWAVADWLTRSRPMTTGKNASTGLFIAVSPFGAPCAKQPNITSRLPQR